LKDFGESSYDIVSLLVVRRRRSYVRCGLQKILFIPVVLIPERGPSRHSGALRFYGVRCSARSSASLRSEQGKVFFIKCFLIFQKHNNKRTSQIYAFWEKKRTSTRFIKAFKKGEFCLSKKLVENSHGFNCKGLIETYDFDSLNLFHH